MVSEFLRITLHCSYMTKNKPCERQLIHITKNFPLVNHKTGYELHATQHPSTIISCQNTTARQEIDPPIQVRST